MSEPCRRFDGEGVARWDAGEPPDEHELGCEDCRAARARYQRLRGHIAALPDPTPPAGWEERVMASVAGERSASPARSAPARWPWLLAAALLGVVVAVLVLRVPREQPLALAHEVVPAASARRSDSAVVGDRLVLRASTGGAAHAELRLYRGERELVLRCPGDPRCTSGPSALGAALTLDAKGSYRALLVAGSATLPEPTGSLDGDVRAAQAAGGRTTADLAVDVE